MFKMQNLNVIKIVETKEEKAALESKGFKQIAEVKPDYDNMTLNDLKAIAKEKSLEGYSSMKKEELIVALKALDSKEDNKEGKSDDPGQAS